MMAPTLGGDTVEENDVDEASREVGEGPVPIET